MKLAQPDTARCSTGVHASTRSPVHVTEVRRSQKQTQHATFRLRKSQTQQLLRQTACQSFGGSVAGHGEYFQPLTSASLLQSQLESGWDVVGLGQAMVDFSASVSDDFLDRLSVEKGSRR